MAKRKRNFLIGSIGYPVLELVYRGRTHWTMSLVGGMSLMTLGRIRQKHSSRPLWQQALVGGLAITSMEYLVGRTFNRRFRIWDYRKTPLNLHGQICLPYTLCWCALSAVALSFMGEG